MELVDNWAYRDLILPIAIKNSVLQIQIYPSVSQPLEQAQQEFHTLVQFADT